MEARDSIEAAEALRAVAELAVDRLNNLPPEILRKVGSRSATWPLIDSPQRNLRDDRKTIFANTQVGKGLPVEIDSSARWILDEAGELAASLLAALHNAKQSERGPLWSKVRSLPPFEDEPETLLAWWVAAWDLFRSSYPHPEEVPEFNRLVTAKSKRKSPGRIKQAIQETLQARFYSLARPDQPYRT